MKRVAPELDGLMWTIAEEGNERAIDEFGERHPELRTELLRRISMVKGLRGARKKPAEPAKTIPRFVPKEVKSRGPIYVVGGLVLAAAAALAFVVTTLLTPVPHTREPALTVQTPPSHPVETKTPPPAPIVRKDPPNTTQPAEQPQTDTVLTPADLHIEHAPLLSVIEMMAERCGVRISAAPGMPNPDVVVDYHQMNAMEMLRDLGKQYRFTPLNQHDGSIMVIPAVDPNNPSGDEGTSDELPTRKIGG